MDKAWKPNTVNVGLSLFLLSTVFTFWGGIYSYADVLVDPGIIVSSFTIPECTSFIVVTIVLGIAFGRYGRKAMLAGAAVSGISTITGIIIMFLAIEDVTGLSVLLAVTGVLFGVGNATAFVAWEYVLVIERLKRARIFFFESLLSYPLAYLLIRMVPVSAEMMSYILVIAVGVSTAFLVFQTQRGPTGHVERREVKGIPVQHVIIAFQKSKSMVFCIVCITLIAAVTRCIALGDHSAAKTVTNYSMLGVSIMAAISIVLWKVAGREIDYSLIYKVAFPVLATGLLLLPMMGSAYQIILTTVAFALFSVSSLFVMYQSICLTDDHGVEAVIYFSFLNGVIYLAVGVGTLLGSYLLAIGDFSFSSLAMVALFLVYILVIVSTSVINRRKDDGEIAGASGASMTGEVPERITGQCMVLSRKARLSKRESEILELIARGRDVPYIAKALYISENTVRTHNKSIYRKIGVHNRQELLSVVEQTMQNGTHGQHAMGNGHLVP